MIPKVDILCRKNDVTTSEIIEKFEEYFFPMFRNIDEKSIDEIRKNYQGPIRFICKNPKGYVSCDFSDNPDLLLSNYPPEKEQVYVEALCEFLNSDKPSKQVKEVMDEFTTDTLSTSRREYSFSIEPYHVWTIASVQRPDPEEAPFTVGFKTPINEMFELFFVFLSMDPQWGFFDTDMQFLQALWENKKEEFQATGSFDEDRIKEIMDRPQYKEYFFKDVRPTVHRKKIAQVKRILDRELEIKVY